MLPGRGKISLMRTEKASFRFPLFVKSDIDGFIGLFIDNLVNLLLITGLCLKIGMPEELVFGKILPGTALSVFAGNIFYSLQDSMRSSLGQSSPGSPAQWTETPC